MHLRSVARKHRLEVLVGGVGGLNLVVLAAQLRGLVPSLYTNADTATGLVLADGLGSNSGHAPSITLGNYHYYEAWLLEKATKALPDHWQIWEALPFAIGFLAIAILGWAAWRALGRRAALLTVVLTCALGDEMRQILFTPVTHGYFVVHAALLTAVLVLLADRAERGQVSWRLLAALAVPVVVLSALGATDKLVELVALPSFALAGCMGWWLHPGRAGRRIAIFCVVVGGASIFGADIVNSAMTAHGVGAEPLSISFVGAGSVLSNLQITVTAWTYLAGGLFWGAAVDKTQLLVFAVGGLALIGLAVLLRLLWRHANTMGTRRSSRPMAQDMFLSFWGLVVVLSLGAFVFTTLPVDVTTARYLPGVFVGAAALLPGLTGTLPVQRIRLAVAVVVFASLIAINHLVEGTPPIGIGPPASTTDRVLRFARAHDAERGYGPYWDASVMTLETRGALQAFPAYPCAPNLCRFPLSQSSAWYIPQSGIRSFLVTDSRTMSEAIASAPTSLGKPVSVARFGYLTVYIYGHDIAADIGS